MRKKENCNRTVDTSGIPDMADVAVGSFRSALPQRYIETGLFPSPGGSG